jgi:hypothetical protein
MEGNVNRSVAITIFAVIVGLIVAAGAYQLGVGHGLVTSGQVAAPVAGAPYGYHGYGWGFGFFPLLGLIFPILFIFLIFGAIGAAFRGGSRRWNGGPWMDRQTMAEEWHRQMHSEGRDRPKDQGTPPRRDA